MLTKARRTAAEASADRVARAAEELAFNVLRINPYGAADGGLAIDSQALGMSREERRALSECPEAIQEYAAESERLRRSGISLADYCQTAVCDSPEHDISDELRSACEKLQAEFGSIIDQSGLAYT